MLILAAAWADCDPSGRLDAAEQALQSLDLEGAQTRLGEAIEQTQCAAIEEGFVARLVVLQGVAMGLAENTAGATERFSTAKTLGVPIPEFGPYGGAVAALWVDAPLLEGAVGITLASPVGSAWRVAVDGVRVSQWPMQTTPGLHVVQILDKNTKTPHYAKVLFAADGDLVGVDHGLPDRPPKGEITSSPSSWSLSGGLGLEFGGGAADSVMIEGKTYTEPSSRLVGLVDAGVRLESGAAWGRASVFVGSLLTGNYIYQREALAPTASRLTWGSELVAGVSFDRIDLGFGIGARLPSRIRLRAVAPIRLVEGVFAEPTLGVNLLTAGQAEPFGGLCVRGRVAL